MKRSMCAKGIRRKKMAVGKRGPGRNRVKLTKPGIGPVVGPISAMETRGKNWS